MGTRNLVGVKQNQKWKIAQYGQWDGYPEGQGAIVLDFLKLFNLQSFAEKLQNCKFVDKARIRECWVEVGDSPNNTSGFVDYKLVEAFNAKFPALSRDTGAKVLELVMRSTGEVELFDDSAFLKDTLFCEFAYIIDLDVNQLLCYAEGDTQRWGCYPLDALPTIEQMQADYENFTKQ